MPIKPMIGAPDEPVGSGHCAVCRRFGDLKRDHCKTTQLFRGNICHGCNKTLPKYDDDPRKLEGAGHTALANYIRSSKSYLIILEGRKKPPLREEAPTAQKDRPGDRGICPVYQKRVLKGEQYVPRIWKGSRGHDWHIECAETMDRT